jgi:hypothetical protein
MNREDEHEDEHDDLGVFVLDDHCEEIEQVLRSLFCCVLFSIFISGFIWLGVYLINR